MADPRIRPHLIGAYGLFWQKDEVTWNPGHGRNWQLLGKVGKNNGRLRVCDFRKARGFYLLFDDYGASYVGLADSDEGLGHRLRAHFKNRKEWSRFCWFAFDDVVDVPNASGWTKVQQRDAVEQVDSQTVVKELEALMIMTLGSRNQNQMKFRQGERWEQVTLTDCQRRGALTKVDPGPLLDASFWDALNELD